MYVREEGRERLSVLKRRDKMKGRRERKSKGVFQMIMRAVTKASFWLEG